MGLESVLAAMSGKRPPLLGETAPPDHDQTPKAEEQQSLLHWAVHKGVGSVWQTPQSPVRDEVEKYLCEGITAVPLFVAGRRGYAASALLFGLNEAKVGDTAAHQVSDVGLGCAKGALTKFAIDKIGARKDFNIALKGMSMGASTRAADVGLSRKTWFDQQDSFQPLAGAKSTVFSALHPVALATDVATFGIAHGGIKAANFISKGAVEASPRLTNALTGTAFGFTSGSLGEMQRQWNEPQAQFDPWKILARGGASAATMTLAAGAGYQISRASGMEPVVKPQTESLIGQSFARSLLEKVSPTRLLAESGTSSDSIAGMPMPADESRPVARDSPSSTTTSSPECTISASPRSRVVRIGCASQIDAAPWDRPVILIERDIGASKEYRGRTIDVDRSLLPALGRCNQAQLNNCQMVASLNTITTDPAKARLLANAIERRGPQQYRVTLHSKWSVDAQGTREKLHIDTDFDQAQKKWNELRQSGAFLSTDAPIRGPWYAQLFEYALMQHLAEPVPKQHYWLHLNNHLRSADHIGMPRDALCSGVNVGQYLGGRDLTSRLCSQIGPKTLNALAPQMDSLSVICSTPKDVNKTVIDVEGNSVRLPGWHAQSVLSINPERQTVTVLNPWKDKPPVTLSYSTFLDSFRRIQTCSFAHLNPTPETRK